MSLQFPSTPITTPIAVSAELPHSPGTTLTQYDAGRLDAWLPAVRDSVQMLLSPLLRQLFDRSDDVFFDLAERAGGTRAQQSYFETMRVLRRERKNVEQGFFSALEQAWTVPGNSASAIDLDFKNGNWTLVDDDALEESLAIEGMVARAGQKHELDLLALNARFTAAHAQYDEAELNLVCPIHPFALSEQLRRALQPLQLTSNAKLAIYKLFEREVLAQLSSLLHAVNDDFIRAQVLPNWTPGQGAAATARTQNSAETMASATTAQHAYGENAAHNPAPAAGLVSHDIAEHLGQLPESAQQQILHLLHELLASQKLGRSADDGFGIPTLPLIETPQLLQALSTLQKASVGEFTLENAQNELQAVDLRTLLAAQLPIQGARVDGHSIGVLNDDVIDIVSMMFDYILGDSNLADDIKAPLARLQIPMLKLAINDRDFFGNRNHPARLLLNEMAYAGIGWDPERRGRDGLQGKVCAVVQRVLNEFDHDPVLFENLLADFRFYVEDENRRSTILERRTREAEEGKARTEEARAAVDQFLHDLLATRTVPAPVQALLVETWSRVLQLEHLRSHGQSESYRQHQDVAMLLVRSVDIRSEAERAELSVLIQQLLPQLRAGFAELALEPTQILAYLKMLEEVHLAALHQVLSVQNPAVAADAIDVATLAQPDRPALVVKPEPVSEPDWAHRRIGDDFVEDEAGVDGAAAGNSEDGLSALAEQLLCADAEAEPAQSEPAAPELPQISAELWAKVDTFPIGSWLQTRDNAGRTLRCKLAAKIPSVGRYVFVNRAGVKVLELQREALALAMLNEEVKMLDDGALFDRALEAVIHNLRLFRRED